VKGNHYGIVHTSESGGEIYRRTQHGLRPEPNEWNHGTPSAALWPQPKRLAIESTEVTELGLMYSLDRLVFAMIKGRHQTG
jgi:hypothetical protein